MADQSSNQQNSSADDVKRMYRSEKNRVIAGVCGGIAEYFKIDPLLVRVGWVVVTILTGAAPGLLAYLVAAVVLPVQPSSGQTPVDKKDTTTGNS
jgi:phage shock protein PspC (stress-responsive transcriptional regulator)